MKAFIHVLLAGLIVFLAYETVQSTVEPIEFKKEQKKRYDETIQKLKDIRAAQGASKEVNGDYTASFDTFSSTKADFITFTGTLTKSSSYYNIAVSGATVTGSLSYPAAYLNADNYNGKEIKVTGYYNGINASGRYRYIIATKIEEIGTPDPGGDSLWSDDMWKYFAEVKESIFQRVCEELGEEYEVRR